MLVFSDDFLPGTKASEIGQAVAARLSWRLSHPSFTFTFTPGLGQKFTINNKGPGQCQSKAFCYILYRRGTGREKARANIFGTRSLSANLIQTSSAAQQLALQES